MIHTCASLIRRRGNWKPKESLCNSRRKQALRCISFFCFILTDGIPFSVPVLWRLFIAERSTDGGCPPVRSFFIPLSEADTSSGPVSRPRPITTDPATASYSSPLGPVLRAKPFPEVTDLICRLPLPTLFYQLESIHLGDLLRLWVR